MHNICDGSTLRLENLMLNTLIKYQLLWVSSLLLKLYLSEVRDTFAQNRWFYSFVETE